MLEPCIGDLSPLLFGVAPSDPLGFAGCELTVCLLRASPSAEIPFADVSCNWITIRTIEIKASITSRLPCHQYPALCYVIAICSTRRIQNTSHI
jgi:hypothetical protein